MDNQRQKSKTVQRMFLNERLDELSTEDLDKVLAKVLTRDF